jgi:hypothetical protein
VPPQAGTLQDFPQAVAHPGRSERPFTVEVRQGS